jgi:hypothetical protein
MSVLDSDERDIYWHISNIRLPLAQYMLRWRLVFELKLQTRWSINDATEFREQFKVAFAQNAQKELFESGDLNKYDTSLLCTLLLAMQLKPELDRATRDIRDVRNATSHNGELRSAVGELTKLEEAIKIVTPPFGEPPRSLMPPPLPARPRSLETLPARPRSLETLPARPRSLETLPARPRSLETLSKSWKTALVCRTWIVVAAVLVCVCVGADLLYILNACDQDCWWPWCEKRARVCDWLLLLRIR